MNRIFKMISVLSAALLLPASICAQTDTLSLTLDKALEIAQNRSLTVMVADKEITRTGFAKKGSYAMLFPQIDFSGSYQRAFKKQTMAMTMNGTTTSIKVGTDNVYSLGFSASMPLVNVELWKSLQITGKSVDLAVEQASQSRQDLINQVQQAFFTCLLASDSYEVYKENYANAKSNYEDAKAKYNSGRSAKYDMIRAEVTMQNAEPLLYDSQNSLVLAQWKLKALIGIDLASDIKCTGRLLDYKENLSIIPIATDSINLDKNSSLKQLDIQDDILGTTYKMQLAKYYPTLSASSSYSWIAMADNFKFKDYNWNPYSIGVLSLNIPIFSGGQRYYNLKQTRVQQEQLKLQREEARRNLVVAVKQNLSSMGTASKQYKAAEASIDGAETGYNIAKKRYEVGSGTLLEMSDSQLALLQARLNLNQSVYSFLIAKSSLDNIMGVNAVEPAVVNDNNK